MARTQILVHRWGPITRILVLDCRQIQPEVYGLFPFVRTDQPAHSHLNENFTFFLIKTRHPDQSNPKYYKQGRWFFSETSRVKPTSLPESLVQPLSGGPFWLLESTLSFVGGAGYSSVLINSPYTAKVSQPWAIKWSSVSEMVSSSHDSCETAGY